MTLLKPSPVPTSRFTWDAPTGAFVAEASDLGVPFGRVWDDACDTGLTLVSVRAGREVVCAVEHEERDVEGDVRWWVLKPVERGQHWAVRVFND